MTNGVGGLHHRGRKVLYEAAEGYVTPCDVCGSGAFVFFTDSPPVTEAPCVCGVYHLVCLPCDHRLGLPWGERTCLASQEARVAAALLGEDR